MSLLLEALKKAERAKEEAQQAQRRARGEAEASELRLEGRKEAPPAADAKPVMTRDELPDIRQPLEILSDDITLKEAAPAPAATVQTSPALEKAAPAARPRAQAEAQAADRATGKKVFEAKFKEPNPRLPFYIMMGCLGVFALGTVGYFWYQLRPPPSLVNTNPAKTGNEVAGVAPGESKPGATASAAPAGPAAIPGLPGTAAAAPTPAVAAPTAAPATAAAAAPKPAPVPRGPTFTPQPRQIEQPALAQTRPPPQVHPKVDSAYTAYLAGDLAAPRSDDQEALPEDGGRREAR